MDMDDEEEAGYSSDEMDTVWENALSDLRSGKVVVTNKDGTLRCPYSPSKKKQSYPYKDLLQHAQGVAKGKKGVDARAKHQALTVYLKTDLVQKATAAVVSSYKVELKHPERRPDDDLRVYPWCGVVYNIDNSRRDGNMRMGPGPKEVRNHFEVFNPDKVHVCWGPRGHMGNGVIVFRRCSEGLKDALAFEEYFTDRGIGLSDWHRRQANEGLGKEIYGWLARADDYKGRRGGKDDFFIAKYLQENFDLKDVGMVGAEKDKIQDQRFQSLADTVHERNKEYDNLFAESEAARRNAEFTRQKREEEHQKELEQVKQKAKQSADDHAKDVLEHNKKLQQSMDTLKTRCKELEEKEKYLVNEFDKRSLEEEKTRNRKKMDACAQQSVLQKEHQAKQAKLIREHQEEWRIFEEKVQNAKLKLERKQQAKFDLSFESERIERELLQSTFEMETLGEDVNATQNYQDLKEKFKQQETEKAQIQQQLDEAQADNETFGDTINVLTHQHRTANDELEAARKVSVAAVQEMKHPALRMKRMGELRKLPWKVACKKKYKNHKEGWEVVLATKISTWEDIITDHDFEPFKTVQVGNEDKWMKVIDTEDAKLRGLKKDLGDDVCQTVIDSMTELNEYNASGRYPIPVAWNFAEKRRASVDEVLAACVEMIKDLDPSKEKRKRAATARS